MRLSCKEAFLFTAAMTLACDDPTDHYHQKQSQSRTYSSWRSTVGLYQRSSLPVKLIRRLCSATLTLDGAGNAVRTERWRYVYQPNRTDEGTFVAHYQYRIIGDSITVGIFILLARCEL